MTEERKYAILFAATLLSARKLMPLLEDESPKPNMAQKFWTEAYVKRAIDQAASILEEIDKRWPSGSEDASA
jgi:hypothetical protein